MSEGYNMQSPDLSPEELAACEDAIVQAELSTLAERSETAADGPTAEQVSSTEPPMSAALLRKHINEPPVLTAAMKKPVYISKKLKQACSIRGVPSRVDVIIHYETSKSPRYIGMTLLSRAQQGSPLYCGLVCHNLHGSPGVVSGMLIPTHSGEKIILTCGDIEGFARLRAMALGRFVLDDNEVVFQGEIPIYEGSVKYGSLKNDNTPGGIIPVYKDGQEVKLNIDLPPLEGPVTSVISLRLVTYSDYTWHPLGVSFDTPYPAYAGGEGASEYKISLSCRTVVGYHHLCMQIRGDNVRALRDAQVSSQGKEALAGSKEHQKTQGDVST